MDRLTDEIRQETPRMTMFADDIVISSGSRWTKPGEMGVCAGKKRNESQNMCVNEREVSGTIRLTGAGFGKVHEFKDSGTLVESVKNDN